MEEKSLFTAEESDAIKSSWSKMTENGISKAGQLILCRLFQDVPEVTTLFYRLGISADESYTLESLSQKSQFNSHAKRLSLALDAIVKKLDDTAFITQKCIDLGKAHKKHNVKPHYFDLLGQVLVNVICDALNLTESHPTVKAWIKAHGAISTALKNGLTSE